MDTAEPVPPSAPRPSAAGRWAKRAGTAAVALAALAVLQEVGSVLVGANFHTVLPGRVYRCAQPSPQALAEMVESHGIRTVVNLRGRCNPFPWYLEEARATCRLDLCQEDICLSAGRLPSVNELRRLIEVLDRTEYPLVFHCRRGADRTGLASAVAFLLQPDFTFAQATRQLSLRYGHAPVGRTTCLDDFLDLYAAWLAGQPRAHSPAAFRQWALHEYTAGECRAAVELLTAAPLRLRAGEPTAVRVRAHNRGVRPWYFRPTLNAGIHVGFHIWDAQDRQVAMDKAGQFDAVVPPGRSIDVTLPLPALGPGRYRLTVDLVDEQRCWFFQAGSEPLEEELEVRE